MNDTGVLERIEQSKQILQHARKKKRSPRILVIEDRAEDREWLCRQLTGIGCEAVEADSGFRAMAAVESKAFDMFLVDLGLPDVEGAQLIRLLREKCPRTPVAVVTGHDDNSTRQKVFECGAIMLFPKPWTRNDCLQLLSLFNLTDALTYDTGTMAGTEGTG